jgi:tetratricopeptide (TPR) repeat protein
MIAIKKNTRTLAVCVFAMLYCIAPHSLFGNTAISATIAHDLLTLEKEFGASTHHIAYIDALIEKAKKTVKVHSNYSSDEQAIETLRSIHSLIRAEGFSFKENFLLFRGIDSKKIDCDNFSTLYIAVAESLKIPIAPVYAPNHSFVRLFFNDGSFINWEPLEGASLPNAWYISKLSIAEKSVKNGVYLNTLSRKEFLGVHYNSMGSYLFSNKKFSDAIPYYTMAISLNPKLSSAFHNRGCAYLATRRMELALADLLKAEELDPGNAATHNTLADIYYDKKDYQNASRYYRAAIVLDPENHVPYHNWGLLMKEIGKDDIAKKLLNKARELKSKHSNK